MIVEIKLKRENGNLIYEITANARANFFYRPPEPLICEDDNNLALLSFRYQPDIGVKKCGCPHCNCEDCRR